MFWRRNALLNGASYFAVIALTLLARVIGGNLDLVPVFDVISEAALRSTKVLRGGDLILDLIH